jgi:hypothetical protein
MTLSALVPIDPVAPRIDMDLGNGGKRADSGHGEIYDFKGFRDVFGG